MAIISFRPKQVSKKLLSVLKDRSFDVIANRYGLTDDSERKTLEAIGGKYGITRERVRQIENAALASIRKSKEMEESKEVFTKTEAHAERLEAELEGSVMSGGRLHPAVKELRAVRGQLVTIYSQLLITPRGRVASRMTESQARSAGAKQDKLEEFLSGN